MNDLNTLVYGAAGLAFSFIAYYGFLDLCRPLQCLQPIVRVPGWKIVFVVPFKN